MLINRLLKKFPHKDMNTKLTIEAEVDAFCQSEYVTKGTIK